MADQFTPFLMSPARQTILNKFNENVAQYNTNSAGNYRNPIFDLRTEQEQAGELDPNALYPNPIFDTTVDSATDDTKDANGCIIGVETYDSFQGQCVAMSTGDPIPENDRKEIEEEIYQGVGSVNSPTQNAFMNLGLGSLTDGDKIPSAFGFNSFNQGLKSILGMIPLNGIPAFQLPLQLGRMQDINTLINSGVIEKGSDGKLYFAKGGNLNLVQANQAFEQDLARQQGLNLDAQSQNMIGTYKDNDGNNVPYYLQQSRGDKADNMSNNVYRDIIGKNNNVTVSPFKSDYGAKEIISYSAPNPNREKSASEKTFDRKQAEKERLSNPFERNR